MFSIAYFLCPHLIVLSSPEKILKILKRTWVSTSSQVTHIVSIYSNILAWMCDSTSHQRSFTFLWAGRRLVYASISSTQPVWESPLFVTVPCLWALLHPEEPPLGPLRQPVRPSDQFTQWVFPLIFSPHTSRNYTFSPRPMNKKLKQMFLTAEWFAFLWLLCECSHRPVNTWSSKKECMERIFISLTVAMTSGPIK